MRPSMLRAFARPRYAALVLVALFAAVIVPVAVVAPAAEAVQSTGGSARFPYVQWISWGANGANLIPNASGDITRTETMNVGGQQIQVTCTIDNLAQTRAATTSQPFIRAYSSGQWRGDGLDELYNIGGTGTSNTLAIGIRSVNDAANVTFDFACSADLVVGSTRTPVTLAGLVLANAESSGSGSGPQGSTWEHIGATIPAAGTWRILDFVRGSACTQDNYARLTGGTGAKTLMLYGAKNGDCEGTTTSRQPNPATVAYMEGVSSATNVTLYGNGYEAVALGVVINTEFGDAPSSYGVAGAISQGGFTGGVPTAYTSGDGQAVSGMSLATASAPVLRLGTQLDFETTQLSNSSATGDDSDGTDDEDGVSIASSYTVSPGGTVTVPNVSCNATAGQPGYVAGWIDFNLDGVFDASEKSANVTCPTGGGTISLTFTAPTSVPPLAVQPTFARFRIAASTADLTPTGIAGGGEVEDYAITTSWPEAPGMKVTKALTSGTVEPGQTLNYLLTFENTGNVPLSSVAITDPSATVSGCTWTTVAPHTSVTCTASHVVTTADVTAGQYTNTATANARDTHNVALTPVTSSVNVKRIPHAFDDAGSTTVNVPLTRAAATGVLANDTGYLLNVTGFTAIDPAKGTLNLSANGAYTFTPASGFSGVVSSTYTVTDGFGATTTAVLTISVAPTAANDSATTTANTGLAAVAGRNVLTNDAGTGRTITTLSPITVTGGTVTFNANGTYVFAPATGFSGTASFPYTMKDAENQTASATLTVTVTPTAANDSASTVVSTTLPAAAGRNVLDNDIGTGKTVSTLAPITVGGGTVTFNANGTYVFVPATGFTGTASFPYTMQDSSGQTASATLTITVTPTAANDTATTAVNTTLPAAAGRNVLDNDLGSGRTVTTTSVTNAAGTVTFNANGTYVFVPATGFTGAGSFGYTMSDSAGQTASATLAITVTPTAANDAASTTVNTSLAAVAGRNVLDNDAGTGKSVTTASVTNAAGTVTFNANGTYSFVPTASFTGIGNFTYVMKDSANQTASAILTISVTPLAANDSASTAANTSLPAVAGRNVLTNDLGTGKAVTTLSPIAVTGGTATFNADGTYTFVPTAGFTGTASFPYTMADSAGQTASAILTITVTPSAVNDSASTTVNTTLGANAARNVLDNDLGTGRTVTTTSVSNAAGTVTFNADGTYVFVPTSGFTGSGSFGYVMKDSADQTASASLTISVTPTAANDTATTPVNTTLPAAAARNVLNNDAGTGKSVTTTTVAKSGGTVTFNADGTYVFVPTAGFTGPIAFDYAMKDSTNQTATATLTITVTPTAANDSATTLANTPLAALPTRNVLDNDLGTGRSVTTTSVTNSAGTVTFSTDGTYVFVPTAGFTGTGSFGYTMQDAASQTATATLTVTVTPTAANDAATTPVNTSLVAAAARNVLENDLGSGKTVTTTSVTNPAGTVTFNSDGTYVFVPAANVTGTATFAYTMKDAGNQTASATLTITVTPTAANDTATTPVNTTLTASAARNVLTNDAGSGRTVTTTSVTNSAGTVTFNADGTYVFVPAANFTGSGAWAYTMKDAADQTASATLTISVTPTAADDSATTPVNVTIPASAARNVLDNDLGTGKAVTTASVTNAAGTVTFNANGTYVFVPAINVTGNGNFSYTMTDSAGQTASATLAILVTPTAANDSAATPVDTALPASSSRNVLANDLGTGKTVTTGTVATLGGTVTFNPNGTYVFVPSSGFTGQVIANYTLEDSAGQTADATLTISVTPTAANDSAATPVNTPLAAISTRNVLDNDLGSGKSVTTTSVTNAAGTVTFSTDGTYVFVPTTGFTGTGSFAYSMKDTANQTASATLTIAVTPTAENDSASTAVNTALPATSGRNVLDNDLGSGRAVTTTSVTNAAGTVTFNADGTYLFMPTTGFTGSGAFPYEMTDSANQTAAATLTITVTPTAANDAASTPVNTSLAPVAGRNVLDNDAGSGKSVITTTVTNAVGTVTFNSDGTYTFVPDSNVTGIAGFTYTMKDSANQLASATLTISVTPTAANDSATTSVNTNLAASSSRNVLGNDLGSGGTVTTASATATGGTVTFNANGTYVFVPATDFTGTATFLYSMRDAADQTASATLSITVTPTAANDSASTSVNTSLPASPSRNVLDNDFGTGKTVTTTSVTSAGGTVTFNADGTYVFVPTTDFSGTATFTYAMKDSSNQVSTAVLSITVAPGAADDAATTPVNMPLPASSARNVLDNDSGSGRTVTTLSPVTAAGGTVTFNADGTYEFVPTAGFTGVAHFTYGMKDATNQASSAVLTISVTPTAANDVATTPVNVPLLANSSRNVLDNDLGSGRSVTTASVTNAGGTVTFSPDGTYSFVPTAGFTGDAQFSYEVTDSAGQTASATLTVSVTPTAANDSASTPVNTPLAAVAGRNVLANDLGAGRAVTTTFVSNGAGTVTFNANGTYAFAPAANFTGSAAFDYAMADSAGQTASATLTITVTPTAADDAATTPVNTSLAAAAARNVLSNDFGTGTAVTTSWVTTAAGTVTFHADGTYEFVPATNFTGVRSFDYTLEDAVGQEAYATLTITVTPTAADDSATTPVNVTLPTAADRNVLDNDLGLGRSVTTASVTNASGTVTFNTDGTYVFVPSTGFTGTGAFAYTIEDAADQTASATLTVHVTPAAADDSASTPVNATLLANPGRNVLANDLGSGRTVTTWWVATAAGIVTFDADGTYEFVPATDFTGVGAFDYEMQDAAGQVATATLTINVTPTAANDSAATTANTALAASASRNVLDNDLGTGRTVTTSIVAKPGGSVSFSSDGTYAFVPDADFTGTVEFDYTMEDAEGQAATATLTVHVTPSAANDSASTPVNVSLPATSSRNVLTNDAGVGRSVTTPSDSNATGTVTFNPNGTYVFVPVANVTGVGTFVYTIEDAEGQSASATLTVTVTPTAANDSATTAVNTPLPAAPSRNVLDNDLGTGRSVTTASVTNAAGTVTFNGDGTYTYTPTAGFTGAGSFAYSMKDAADQTDLATLTISVTPSAVDDSASTAVNTSLAASASRNVLANDLGTGRTITTLDPMVATGGTVTFHADGTYVFAPDTDFTGTVNFDYTMQDSAGQSASATLTVAVTPGAADDTASTPVNTALAASAARNVLDNDSGTGRVVTTLAPIAAPGGTVTFNADGTYVFVPSANVTGMASFAYTMRDSANQSSSAVLRITVTPTATDDVASTPANTTLAADPVRNVLDNDLGTGRAVTTLSPITMSGGAVTFNADGTYLFVPAAGFTGDVSFDYGIEDSNGESATALLTVTVTPTAADDSATTPVNTALAADPGRNVLANDLGFGRTVTTGSVANSAGTVTFNSDGTYVFVPFTGFTGDAQFVYTIEDLAHQTASATLTISVTPTASNDSATTPVNTTLAADVSRNVLANDLGTGRSVTTPSVSNSGGTVTFNSDGTYVFVPAADFTGTASFGYTMADAEGRTATATLTISITPGAHDDAAITSVNTPLPADVGRNVLANDLGTGRTVTTLSPITVAGGSVTFNADGTYSFVPTSGFTGTASFPYEMRDAAAQTASATLTITVTPTASNDTAATVANTTLPALPGRNVLDNDLGTGRVVTTSSATGPGGTVSFNSDGTYAFVPTDGFTGMANFVYEIEDSSGQTATAVLAITVAPTAANDAASTPINVALPASASRNVLGNDVGVGKAVTTTSVTNAAGTVTFNPDGTYVFTPTVDFSGTGTFSYILTDASSQTATATLTITVNPVASNDETTTTGGTPKSVDAEDGVLSNDAGSGVEVTDYEQVEPTKGSILINPDGSFTFTPVQGFHGTVTVNYTIADEQGNEANAVLTILVGADLPLQVAGKVGSICVADVPYLTWNLALPAGFPSQGADPLTITFINPGGEDFVVTDLPLSGQMLWPGASATEPKQWPGWVRNSDGTYSPTSGNYAWTREGIDVLFKVNPERTVTVHYPQATALCANPAKAAQEPPKEASNDDPRDSLSHTGATVMGLLPFAGAFVLFGFFLVFVARRRREDDAAA